MPSYDILCIGDVNVDLILSGLQRLPQFGEEVLAQSVGIHLGGCTANVALFAAHLGLKTALRARVGTDDFGDFLMAELERLGVSTELILRDPDLRTGITVSLSGRSDRAFVTYLGTIDSLTRADVTDELLASARHIHVGSYFLQSKLQPQIGAILARARELGCTTSLDTGFDPAGAWDGGLRNAIAHATVFLPNEVEAAAIAGVVDLLEAARQLARTGARVAVKMGEAGAALVTDRGLFQAPALPVPVVDTTCCGDAFNAGLLCAMLDGKPEEEQLRWGCAAGALIAGGSGACAERLSRTNIEKLLAGR
jgi:sugar/nucleoside kinase (ribokinase family)